MLRAIKIILGTVTLALFAAGSVSAAHASTVPTGVPKLSTPQTTTPYFISNHGSPAMYMNGAGVGCNGAKLVGWKTSLGTFTNEEFLIYAVDVSSHYMIQAAWCSGAGNPHAGVCIYDAGSSHPFLTLGACNPSDQRDVFEDVVDGNVSQLINLWWSTYAGAGNQNGARLFDGNYIYGNSDWQYTPA